MLLDLDAAVAAIAAHLDLPYHPDVATRCAFDAMRRDSARYEPRSVQWAPGFNFLRRGARGDGDASLSPAAKALLDADLAAVSTPLAPAARALLLAPEPEPPSSSPRSA